MELFLLCDVLALLLRMEPRTSSAMGPRVRPRGRPAELEPSLAIGATGAEEVDSRS